MRAEKGFEGVFETSGPDRDVGGAGSRHPGGAEAGMQAGAGQLPHQHLHERGRRCRRVREAHGAGLEQGFGEGGVRGDGAQDRFQGGE